MAAAANNQSQQKSQSCCELPLTSALWQEQESGLPGREDHGDWLINLRREEGHEADSN
jgi:hypothetical protein